MTDNRQKPIDFTEIASLLWGERKFIIKTCVVVLVFAIVYAFSLPRTYTVGVTLAPEASNSSLTGSIGALADMAGLGFGGATGDAIYPEIYPELIGSKEFLVDLFPTPVKSHDGDIQTTLYDYQRKHQKIAWWMYSVVWANKFVKWVKGEPANAGNGAGGINPFMLTKEQSSIADAVKANIMCTVDKKTGVITLRYTAQDPLVAATMVNVIKDKLQEHIVEYRTCKARNDLKYFEALCDEARADYIKAQEIFAAFSDSHKGAMLQSVAMQMSRLENDVMLAQQNYSQASQQLQLTRAKLQENTPAFAVLSGASVPLKPSAPRRMFMVLALVMMGAFGASAYVYVKDLLQKN